MCKLPIPEDVAELLANIENWHLPTTDDSLLWEYETELREVVGTSLEVENMTDFNYGRAYGYHIGLVEGISYKGNVKETWLEMRQMGVDNNYWMGLAVSLIGSFYKLWFMKETAAPEYGRINGQQLDKPFLAEHCPTVERVEKFLQDKGYRRLHRPVLELEIPWAAKYIDYTPGPVPTVEDLMFGE